MPLLFADPDGRIPRAPLDVASDVGVNLCNVKSCLNTSNNEIFTDKRGDLPCVNISKHTCPVVKCSDEKFVLVYIYLSF